MQFLNIKEILDRALVAEYGLAVMFPSLQTANYQRRRFYAEREKLRKAGNQQYDDLSLLTKKDGRLMIIKRHIVNSPSSAGILECRDIMPAELPNKIQSRGKSRCGIGIS